MLITRGTLGSCSACGDFVALVLQNTGGFRRCHGCGRTGPDAVLASEVRLDIEDDRAEFDADDFTQISATPWELIDATRRG